MRHANRGSGVTALIAEQFGDEIGRAVHHLGQGVEARLDVEEPTKPHDLLHLVEVAERRVRMGKHIDDAEPGRLACGFDLGVGRELALVALSGLPSSPNGSWPEMNRSDPARTEGT